MWSNKEADFFPEIKKGTTFPGMGVNHLARIPGIDMHRCRKWSRVWYQNNCPSFVFLNIL